MPKPGEVGVTLPPDGGWGWVIVIASGIASGFPAGFHRSVTLFYNELMKVFKRSATSTATVMSVDTVIGALTSPIAGALCNRFGCRPMAMMAGVLIALAFFASAFVPTLFYFYFTFSLLRGFGSTVFAVARISVINLYFDCNKGKANAISAMFYSLGSVYMAPLITIFFTEYGLQGTLMICSALMLHIIPAAALFRPLSEVQPVTKESLDHVKRGFPGEKPIPKDKPEIKEKVMERYAVQSGKEGQELECPASFNSSEPNNTISGCIEQDGMQCQEPQNSMSGKSLTTTEEITLLPPFQNIPKDGDKIALPENSVQLTHDADMANEYCGTPVTTQCVVRQRSVLEHHPDLKVINCQNRALTYMKSAIGVFTGGVFQHLDFILYSFFMSSYAYTHVTTFTFLSGLALQKGSTIEQCTIAMAVISGIEIPLRLSYGFFFDLKAVRPSCQFVFGVCGCCIGVLVCMLPLFPGHVTVLVIWAIQQAICGVIVCQWSTVMSDILPRAQLTSGFGVLRFIMGVGSLFAPLCGGAMRDGSGSYSLAYFVAGAQLLISSIVLLIHNVRKRILDRRQQNASSA